MSSTSTTPSTSTGTGTKTADTSTISYLRSLPAVRERSSKVYELARSDQLDHWDFNEGKLDDVVEFCEGLLQRDFGDDYGSIPPHCRANHFLTQSPPIDRIQYLLNHPSFPPSSQPLERAATLIDLYLVSVLLDAGAGPDWNYTEEDPEIPGETIWSAGRSEGLAVGSYHMFKDGVFSSDPERPLQVDAAGLKSLTVDTLAKHLQVSDTNPMAGLEGRCNLLIQLGSALKERPDICANGRPGGMMHYFASSTGATNTSAKPSLPLSHLWSTLFTLLLPIWPARTALESSPTESLGDVWPCPALARSLDAQPGIERTEGDDLVPFHKLSQWLCYSLVQGIESEGGWKVESEKGSGQTGLPEYRNGGLLVDHGVLTIRRSTLPESALSRGEDMPPLLEPSHPAVVEWRAVTVIALDKIHEKLCTKLSVSTDGLSLAQVLEACTWKGGREIAKQKREGGGPPIDIVSDGTVF